MSNTEPNAEQTAQPAKHQAKDLAYLYDFICECPNPRITDAIKRLVDRWLETADQLPEFSEALKHEFETTDAEAIEISWLLSINPNTPPSVLQDLCSGASDTLLERIAENSRTGASTLAELSFQAVAEIRIATAGNRSTPLASIMMLVKDDNPDVRFSIAENANIPQEALEALSKDDNPYVKLRADVTLARAEVERNVFNKEQPANETAEGKC
jgi:hypothetical protein